MGTAEALLLGHIGHPAPQLNRLTVVGDEKSLCIAEVYRPRNGVECGVTGRDQRLELRRLTTGRDRKILNIGHESISRGERSEGPPHRPTVRKGIWTAPPLDRRTSPNVGGDGSSLTFSGFVDAPKIADCG
ncbi:hypothetical protein ACVWXL_008098 [Bradyrhizobium sp. GM22.5]